MATREQEIERIEEVHRTAGPEAAKAIALYLGLCQVADGIVCSNTSGPGWSLWNARIRR